MKGRSQIQTNVAMDDDAAAFRVALARAIGFSASELSVNRSGRIARSQCFPIVFDAFRPAVRSGAVLLGWLCLLYFRDLLLPDTVLALIRRAGPFFLLITAATAGAFLLGIAQSARLGWQVLLDLKDGECDTISGRVSTYTSQESEVGVSALFSAKLERFYYWIGDYKLEVSPSAYELLVKRYDEQACPPMRLYFTPRSKLLLSAEPVLGSKQGKPPSIWLRPAG
jgi:hypothetical protein